MRRFELYRFRDPSGVSGIGSVAEEVEFPFDSSGHAWTALKWHGEYPSLVWWRSVDDLLEVHGHLGASEVRWIDSEPHLPQYDGVIELPDPQRRR